MMDYLLANLKDDGLEDKQWPGGSNDSQRLTSKYGVAEAAYGACQQHLNGALCNITLTNSQLVGQLKGNSLTP